MKNVTLGRQFCNGEAPLGVIWDTGYLGKNLTGYGMFGREINGIRDIQKREFGMLKKKIQL